MNNILRKEMKLSASVLSYLFIAFGFMFMLPGYPILCGVFFTTLGIFQTFQSAREANDIVFTVLLPISKRDAVKGRYEFVCIIELCSFVIMAVCTVIRMTVLSGAAAYRNNALMNANPFALGAALFIFGLFNLVFVGGFFKTAYKFAVPFVKYIIVSFIVVSAAEAAHHFPGLENLNAFGFDCLPLQLISLCAGAVMFALLTLISFGYACVKFDGTDLW